jgi:hypothetical protein
MKAIKDYEGGNITANYQVVIKRADGFAKFLIT